MNYYLAIDIGASSGRHILGHMEGNRLVLEEIHRFENGFYEKNTDGERLLCWNHAHLFDEICCGLRKCSEAGKIPVSMAIDTWGVDFVLLDAEDKLIGDTVSYRDARTTGMAAEVNRLISPEELYSRTGIQHAVFNTIYQLMAIKQRHPEQLSQSRQLLFTPDYFNWLLTGQKACEYTIASTSNLLDAKTKNWDFDLIKKLGFPAHLFGAISQPGTCVGSFREDVAKRVGFQCKVLLTASHDTAAAVLAVPMKNPKESIYLSSGTWSLLGLELAAPLLSEESRQHNFTNEGGYGDTYRYLSNIMGLWMIQSVRRELNQTLQSNLAGSSDTPVDSDASGLSNHSRFLSCVPSSHESLSFAALCQMAEEEDSYPGRVDVNDSRFLAPDSMIDALCEVLSEAGFDAPKNAGQLASCIYHSLALKYAAAIRELERLTGKQYDKLHIVGGGCNADYLNRLTQQATGKEILAGPSEGTSIGNILVQLLSSGELKSVAEARELILRSFEIIKYTN